MQALATEPVSRSRTEVRSRFYVPTLSDVLFGALIVWLFVTGEGWKGMLGDGDTGWHIRTGEWIFSNGRVPNTDIFSLTKFGQPWFAWEWLSDVIFAALHNVWGLKALAWLGAFLFCGAGVMTFQRMLWREANLFIALVAGLLAIGAASIHQLSRPHLFTLFLVPLALWMLDADRKQQSARVWLLVPLSALWTNLHGGFVGLIAILGIVAAGETAEGWLSGGTWRTGWDRGRRYFLLFGASAAATLANPFGYQLHVHVAKYLKAGFILDYVQEFQSPKFRDESVLQFGVLLYAGLAIGGLLLRQRRVTDALLMFFWAQAALTSVRHVPIFAVVAAPVIAGELSKYWRLWVSGLSKRSIARIFEDLSVDVLKGRVYTGIWTAIVFITFCALDFGRFPKDFPDIAFPIKIIDKHPSVFASGQPLPRLLASDQWGDYLIYRFYPHARVAFDGRSDFYGKDFVESYLKMANGKKGWKEELRKYNFDYALVPVGWSLSELLRTDPEWKLLAEDKIGLLYQRSKSGLMKPTDSAERLERSLKSLPTEQGPDRGPVR